MDEDIKEETIIKKITKQGGGQGVSLTKKDGYSKEDIDSYVKISKPKKAIPFGEFIRKKIDSNCNAYLTDYYNIMENVFYKLVGDSGYIELLDACLLYTSPSPRD